MYEASAQSNKLKKKIILVKKKITEGRQILTVLTKQICTTPKATTWSFSQNLQDNYWSLAIIDDF